MQGKGFCLSEVYGIIVAFSIVEQHNSPSRNLVVISAFLSFNRLFGEVYIFPNCG